MRKTTKDQAKAVKRLRIPRDDLAVALVVALTADLAVARVVVPKADLVVALVVVPKVDLVVPPS